MITAERVDGAEEGIELAENDFMLLFENKMNNTKMSLHLVGNEGDSVLQAGSYSSAEGKLVVANSGIGIAGQEVYISEGVAKVALDIDIYQIEVKFKGDNGIDYVVSFNGMIDNMTTGGDEPVDAFVPVKVVAETNESWDLGNFMLQLYIDGTRYHELDMYDTVNPNRNYLSAGTYTTTDGTIGEWSIFNTGVDQNCAVLDAEITIVINEDESVKISGYIKSEEEHEITVEWQGVVEGFNFATGGDAETFNAPLLDVEYNGQAYSVNYNYYVTLSDNGFNANGNMKDNSTYYFFDLYSNVAGGADGGVVPAGNYVLASGMGVNTFDPEYSYAVIIKNGEPLYKLYSEAVVVVSENRIEAQIVFEDGTLQSVVYEGTLAYGDGGNKQGVRLSAESWEWGGSSNYGNYYTVSGSNFSVDVHFGADVASATSLAEGSYTWVSTSFFGYEEYPHFTTRTFKVDGNSLVVDSGEASVELYGSEYFVKLTLNTRNGECYIIEWVGELESTASEPNEAIIFSSMTYKGYNSDYYFYIYTLTDENGNSLDLLVNDYQCNPSKIYSGYYEWISKSYCGGLEYFSTDNIVINGSSYKAQGGFMVVECEEDNKLALGFELTLSNGAVQACSYYGYVAQ